MLGARGDRGDVIATFWICSDIVAVDLSVDRLRTAIESADEDAV